MVVTLQNLLLGFLHWIVALLKFVDAEKIGSSEDLSAIEGDKEEEGATATKDL